MKSRVCAAVLALALLPSCARIMHPERVGNTNGEIDIGPLVVGCLLFLPGIVPGAIALAVDFGTGAIFINSRSSDIPRVERSGALALRPQRVPAGSTLHVRLVDTAGRVLAEDHVQGTGRRADLNLRLEPAAEAHHGEHDIPLTLQLQLDDGPIAAHPLMMG